MTIITGEILNTATARNVSKNTENLPKDLAFFLSIFTTENNTRAQTAILIPAKACWMAAIWEKFSKNFDIKVMMIREGVIKPRLATMPPIFFAIL